MLEQFRCSKEECRRLLRSKSLPDIKQVHYSREECSAFSRTNWRFIENPGFLDDGGFVVIVGAEPALVLLFRCERHGGWVLVAVDVTFVDVVGGDDTSRKLQPHFDRFGPVTATSINSTLSSNHTLLRKYMLLSRCSQIKMSQNQNRLPDAA